MISRPFIFLSPPQKSCNVCRATEAVAAGRIGDTHIANTAFAHLRSRFLGKSLDSGFDRSPYAAANAGIATPNTAVPDHAPHHPKNRLRHRNSPHMGSDGRILRLPRFRGRLPIAPRPMY